MNLNAVKRRSPDTAGEASLASTLKVMARAAVRAPSGDNLQPWSIRAGADGRSLEIHLDPARDPSALNSAQRMALIACGAALENAQLIAVESGWACNVELSGGSSGLLARISLRRSGELRDPARVLELIAARAANRRLYDAQEISNGELEVLRRLPAPADGTSCHWIAARSSINSIAEIAGSADGVLFGNQSMRAAFLSNVRFDLPANAQASVGLPLSALEANAALTTGLRLMRRFPALFTLTGGRSTFTAHARKLITSASGLCLVTVDEQRDNHELAVGRTMQSAWLGLTERGYAAQPMMSLMVLDNALRHGAPELVAALLCDKAGVIWDTFRQELRALGISGRPAFLLRFGFAAPPSGRTGRLEPDA